MRTRITTALTLALLTLTACGSDNDAGNESQDNNTMHTTGETITINPDSGSDINTTLELTINTIECGLKKGEEITLYNDGTTDKTDTLAPAGWEYCRIDLAVTNTGSEPTLVLPTVGQAIADGKTISPGDDKMINMYATGASLHPAEKLNPDTSIEYTIFRSYPTGTEIEAVEIVRDEYSPEVVATVAVN